MYIQIKQQDNIIAEVNKITFVKLNKTNSTYVVCEEQSAEGFVAIYEHTENDYIVNSDVVHVLPGKLMRGSEIEATYTYVEGFLPDPIDRAVAKVIDDIYSQDLNNIFG